MASQVEQGLDFANGAVICKPSMYQKPSSQDRCALADLFSTKKNPDMPQAQRKSANETISILCQMQVNFIVNAVSSLRNSEEAAVGLGGAGN